MKTKLKIFTILAFAVFAGVFLAGDGNGRARTGTAGLKFKNVKVLTEMPADQMGKVMNIMSASLGVNCSFCQVGDDFSKDGKEEKEAARRMIEMNFTLRRQYWGFSITKWITPTIKISAA